MQSTNMQKDIGTPLGGLTFRDPAGTPQKLRGFRAAAPDKLYCLFDFDRTLTTTAHLGKDVTIWDLLDGLIPASEREAYVKLSKQYQQMEMDGQLTQDHALEWWALSFEMYIQHGVNMEQIRKVLGELKIRRGAAEMFKLCETANVPTVILSAGIGDVIKIITEEHGMRPAAILSTQLHFSEDGRMTGWDADSLVHILNKHDKGHPKLAPIRAARPYTILVGDSLEDARMVKGDEDVLRIRVGDHHWSNKSKWEEYLAESFEAGYDIVLEQEDLLPVVELAKWLLKK